MIFPKKEKLFLLQRECTDLYLRMHKTKDIAAIAEEFNEYMRKMESGELKVDCLNFCIYNFGELLQVMAKVERWEDIIRIGNFIKDAPNFSGSIARFIRLCVRLPAEARRKRSGSQVHKYERMYLEALEKREGKL